MTKTKTPPVDARGSPNDRQVPDSKAKATAGDADVILQQGRLLLYWATRDPDFKRQMQGVAAAPLGSDFARNKWTQLNLDGPSAYRWPIYFFIGVAFWNLVGAGLFGFLINPPIALYYMQSLNTTPVHAHTPWACSCWRGLLLA
jgi:hypothetical protein